MRMARITSAVLTSVSVLQTGCETCGAREALAASKEAAPQARIQIHGLSCPYCVHNVERSLRGVAGVRSVATDLNTGVATVRFTAAEPPAPKALWQAVEDSGFQPVHVEVEGKTYEFAKQ